MKWTDIEDIVEKLEEIHPEVEILSLRYTLLKKMIEELADFDPENSECNEKILEAVQKAWLEEREDK